MHPQRTCFSTLAGNVSDDIMRLNVALNRGESMLGKHTPEGNDRSVAFPCAGQPRLANGLENTCVCEDMSVDKCEHAAKEQTQYKWEEPHHSKTFSPKIEQGSLSDWVSTFL